MARHSSLWCEGFGQRGVAEERDGDDPVLGDGHADMPSASPVSAAEKASTSRNSRTARCPGEVLQPGDEGEPHALPRGHQVGRVRRERLEPRTEVALSEVVRSQAE